MKKNSIVVVDNGAATIKLGVVHGKAKVVPRFVRSVCGSNYANYLRQDYSERDSTVERGQDDLYWSRDRQL